MLSYYRIYRNMCAIRVDNFVQEIDIGKNTKNVQYVLTVSQLKFMYSYTYTAETDVVYREGVRPGFRIRIISMLIRIRIQLFTLMRIRIQLFTSMRIRNLILINVMRTSDHWPTGPPGLHFEPPKLYNFDFNAIYSNADPDPASKTTRIRNPG